MIKRQINMHTIFAQCRIYSIVVMRISPCLLGTWYDFFETIFSNITWLATPPANVKKIKRSLVVFIFKYLFSNFVKENIPTKNVFLVLQKLLD